MAEHLSEAEQLVAEIEADLHARDAMQAESLRMREEALMFRERHREAIAEGTHTPDELRALGLSADLLLQKAIRIDHFLKGMP